MKSVVLVRMRSVKTMPCVRMAYVAVTMATFGTLSLRHVRSVSL